MEAFIAGWGLEEALKRSEAYLSAGADAILMHSKKSDPSDIESFVKAWNNQVRSLPLWFVLFDHKLSQMKAPSTQLLCWETFYRRQFKSEVLSKEWI